MTRRPPHAMQLPRDIWIGPGALQQLIAVCRGLGVHASAFILSGPRVYDVVTHAILRSLEDAGYAVTCTCVDTASLQAVQAAKAHIEAVNPNLVLGVGGGKAIDVAKLSSTLAHKPFISVPTAASHDGISSPRASLQDAGEVTSIQAQAPLAILADTDVIAQAPYRLTASGCGDVIAKYTAVHDWEAAYKQTHEYYGAYAANLARMSATLVLDNAHAIAQQGEDGLRILLEALISCGVAMSIAGSSRPCSGSEHLFSHALDRVAATPALHGEQCGVGAIMMAYLQKQDWRRLREKLQILGAPTTAAELGVDATVIVEALILAHTIRPDRPTVLGHEGLTRDAARALAEATHVLP